MASAVSCAGDKIRLMVHAHLDSLVDIEVYFLVASPELSWAQIEVAHTGPKINMVCIFFGCQSVAVRF
jgi:hypothetical protein